MRKHIDPQDVWCHVNQAVQKAGRIRRPRKGFSGSHTRVKQKKDAKLKGTAAPLLATSSKG
jgi:hypothetical protein